MNSSSSTAAPKFPGTAAHPVAGFAETNKSFVSKFKKDNKVLTQTKLPSRVETNNAEAVSLGYTMTDAIWWRRFVEEFKFNPDAYSAAVTLVLAMALKCECHPCGLIHFGRTTYGFKQFGVEEVFTLRDNMLDYEPSLEEGEYEETGEHDENPTSAEAYEIDDDVQVVSNSKKRRLQSAAEALSESNE
jgi:hypothetical protein